MWVRSKCSGPTASGRVCFRSVILPDQEVTQRLQQCILKHDKHGLASQWLFPCGLGIYYVRHISELQVSAVNYPRVAVASYSTYVLNACTTATELFEHGGQNQASANH